MSFRFWRRIGIAPPACRGALACGAGRGVTLNLSNSGGSLSFRARSELEKFYAEDPDYEDVAARLEL